MLNHFIELRRRFIFVLSFFCVFFLLFFCIADNLFQIIIFPLQQALPGGVQLIATDITTPFYTPIKIAADASFILIIPFVLFHVWSFVYPGLNAMEVFNIRFVIIGSFILFLAGLLFSYFLVLPFVFKFVINIVPSSVRLMPDMAFALDFITRMLVVFGLCFQLPLISFLLVKLRLISLSELRLIRPYFIVFAFIVGMLLTPPDVFSQVMLAMPLVILYEIGIFIAKRQLVP